MSPLSIEQRVFLAAVASVTTHQVQSYVEQPEEHRFRVAVMMVFAAATAIFLRLPQKSSTRIWRGMTALLLGLGPTGGALVGHIMPLLRRGEIVPVSETAMLNLGGGAFLVVLGVALLGRKEHDIPKADELRNEM